MISPLALKLTFKFLSHIEVRVLLYDGPSELSIMPPHPHLFFVLSSTHFSWLEEEVVPNLSYMANPDSILFLFFDPQSPVSPVLSPQSDFLQVFISVWTGCPSSPPECSVLIFKQQYLWLVCSSPRLERPVFIHQLICISVCSVLDAVLGTWSLQWAEQRSCSHGHSL